MTTTIEKKGCGVCGWDAGDAHDPLPHYLKHLKDEDGSLVDPAIRVINVYLKGMTDLSAICAQRELNDRKKIERIDLRLTQLDREARDAAGKGKQ